MTGKRAVADLGAVVALNLAISGVVLSDAGRAAAREYLGSSPTLAINLLLGAACLAFALWLARRDASTCGTLGLVAIPLPRAIAWAAGAALASKLIAVPLVAVYHALGNHDRAMLDKIEHLAQDPLRYLLAIAVWAGIWEELVFRGFVMSRARVACRSWLATPARADAAAVVLQATAFGLVHIWQNLEGQLNAVLTGIVLGYVALRCRSIIPGMIGHAMIDVFALIVAHEGWVHR